MCLIIHKPRGIKITDLTAIENAYNNNPDGFGIAIRKPDGNMSWKKGLLDVNDICDIVEKIDEQDEAIIHFRMMTHGAITQDNCHPFVLGNDEAVLMHNGIFSIEMPKDYEGSDTRYFVEKHGAKLLTLPKKSIKKIEGVTGNRLAIMKVGDEEVKLIGDWKTRQGCNVSNTYSLQSYYDYYKGKTDAYYGLNNPYEDTDHVRYVGYLPYFKLRDGTYIDQDMYQYTDRELNEMEDELAGYDDDDIVCENHKALQEDAYNNGWYYEE